MPCLDPNGFPQPSRVEETCAGFVVEINNVATYHCEDEPGRSAAAIRDDGASLCQHRQAAGAAAQGLNGLQSIRGLVQYLRTIGYKAWIEDANGNVMEKTVLKNTIK